MTIERYLMSAQKGGQSYWIATLGGTGDDYGYGIAVDSSGNVYVAGSTDSTGAGLSDILITKYNTSGTIQWQRTLGGSSDDYGFGIAVDSSGNVYVTGRTASTGAALSDILITKYNTSGTIQWQRTLGGSNDDYGYGIAVDSSGNVYVTGSTFSTGAGNADILITKYNTSGTIQWQRTLGGTSVDYALGIAVDSSGNVYVIGYTSSTGAGGLDVLITKYNTSGTLQWQRTLGGTGYDYGYGIAVDSSGNVYVTGYTRSSGAGSDDALIAKYNTSGVIQWQRTLGGTSNDYGYGIAVDSSGNVYVAGSTNSTGAGGSDVLITKYNTSGTIQWQRTLGGSGYEDAYSIAVDSIGNVYVTGATASTGAGNADILITKLPGDGSLTGTYGPFTYAVSTLTDSASSLTDAASSLTDAASSLTDAASSLTSATSTLTSTLTPLQTSNYWIGTLGGGNSNSDYGYGIAVDSIGNIYVTGETSSTGAGYNDALIAKYNTSGVIQWQRTLGGTSGDYGIGIAVDSSGNVYVTGYTDSTGAGGYDALITKYNTSGTIQWQRTLGGTGYDYGIGIAVDSSGNVYVAGRTESTGAGISDALITKYNTSGTIQWQRTLGGSNNDYGIGIAVDSSGNVYITGYTNSTGAGGLDILITKYNTSGTIQWQRTLGGTSGDYGQGIAVDSSGNVYVTGATSSSGAGSDDALIAKYDTSGTLQWQRTIGGSSGNDGGQSIAVDSSGNVYITGYANTGALTECLITKYNTSGTLQWQRTLTSSLDDNGYGIAVDSIGNMYITGFSQFVSTYDILIAKLLSDGTLTGTYGPFTYAASSLTDAAGSLTSSTSTLTDAASSLTSSTSTLTDATSALNRTTYYIGV